MYIFELHDPLFLPHCGCELRLSLAKAQALVILGENGIGKSTLLHRWASQLEVNRRSVVEQKSSDYFFDRKLKLIKQFFIHSNLPQFNANEFLSWWNLFELESKEERLLSQLSGGEAQGLKLALALCKDADFYFLDEPSQHLDKRKKEILFERLEKLRASGKSIVVVEHQKENIPIGWKALQLEIQQGKLKAGDEWTI